MTSTASTDLPFAIVPEWLVDADCSDRAFRVYALLARYADSDGGGAIPGRRKMAQRLGCSVDTIDRAVAELIELGAVEREHRYVEGRQTSNAYVVRRIPPEGDGTSAAPRGSGSAAADGSGTSAAGGSRTDAARVPRASMTESHTTETSTSDDESSTALVPATKVAADGWDDARALCDYLADAIVDSGGPGTRRPSVTQGWVATMEKVVRLDERTPEQVRAAIDWVHRASPDSQGAWWQDKVLSPEALRRHYEKLRRQAARRDSRQPPGVALANGYADAAARLRSRT